MIQFAEALQQEWLETNGLGGFSSSTALGLNTRRYHGLLTAATKPPVGRLLLLSKLEETLIVDGDRFELASNQYPGVVHPQGFQYLVSFTAAPFPQWTFRCGEVELIKRLFMVHDENTIVVEYECSHPCTLELRPLIAFRDYHCCTHENSAINTTVEFHSGLAILQPYPSLPAFYLANNAQQIDATSGNWFRNFEYTEELARGLDGHEDLFQPCVLFFDLATPAIVIASTEAHSASQALALKQAEATRRAQFTAPLAYAADQFIVDRRPHRTVIAGYHWFSDWGRDTMISLPGLTLSTGRHAVAREILLAFANVVDQGMVPNRFPDAGEAPEYNTVDATLWFFEAVRAYLEATGEEDFVMARLYPVLVDIIDWHVRGTRFNIGVDTDGLLHCGEAGVQLTWMDAKVGDWVVTPRQGKPVEIQALWYNALCFMASLSGESGYQPMADAAQASFNQAFWNSDAQCLYDVIDGNQRDASIRPNQIFAVSLPHAILASPERARAVVTKVEQQLLTPMGLRTLAPDDPNYHGSYNGNALSRDGAYHQGTVWPWLIGPFLRAYRKVHGESPTTRAQAHAWLAPLLHFAATRGLGQLPEIADGDFPHAPKGCIAQAWSIAEVLRSSMME